MKNKYEVLLPENTVPLIRENPELVEVIKKGESVIIIKLLQEPYENVMVALYNMGFGDEPDEDDMVDISVEVLVVSVPNEMTEAPSIKPNTPLYMLVNDIFHDIMMTTLEEAKKIVDNQE